MLRLVIAAAAALGCARAATVSVQINTQTLLATLGNYLAINIDAGSLFNNLDFTDVALTNLLTQLSSVSSAGRNVLLRIGGGAADDLLYFGDNGPSGNGGDTPWNHTVAVNQTYWDQIVAFSNKTGAKIVWNLNGVLRDAKNAYDPSINATALFSHIVSAGQEQYIQGWQLGNEPTLWSHRGVTVSGQQLGADYTKLKSVLKGYPTLPQTVWGPEGCCNDFSFLADFLPVVHASSSLDFLSEHFYPIGPNPKACSVANYLNKSYYDSVIHLMGQYQSLIQQYAPGTPLVLGETATTNLGGCPTLSASFVSGFYWTYILGAAASNNIVQINRQDLAGYSSQTEPSQYMLSGVPGWTSAAANGPLRPHPDWYTSVLFQQLFSGKVLQATWDGGNYNSSFGLYSFCSSPDSPQGAVVTLYANPGSESVSVNFADASFQASSKTVWILTSSSQSVRDSSDPPSSLTADEIYLNGQLLSVDGNGLLPQSPLAGQTVATGPVTLPPYSYGFVQVDKAAVAVCA